MSTNSMNVAEIVEIYQFEVINVIFKSYLIIDES